VKIAATYFGPYKMKKVLRNEGISEKISRAETGPRMTFTAGESRETLEGHIGGQYDRRCLTFEGRRRA